MSNATETKPAPEMIPCTRCNGRGYHVEDVNQDCPGMMSAGTESECKVCEGNGEIEAEEVASKPAPLRLSAVLPWVRKAFILAMDGAGAEIVLIEGTRCRACMTLVAPTADALASHECAT